MGKNYSNSIVYKLSVAGSAKSYIGSTTLPAKQRLSIHKSQYKRYSNKKAGSKYCSSFEIGDIASKLNSPLSIETLEEYSCDNAKQLRERERYWIEKTNGTVNKNVPTGTIEEWKQKNKEYFTNYYSNNKDKFATYYQKQKDKGILDKVKCPRCGKLYTKTYLKKHLASNNCFRFELKLISSTVEE
jgi:alpha-L-fucosidase